MQRLPPLLRTKIRPPRRRPDQVRRERLVDALLDHVDRKLVLVVASAGYGKTVLLTDLAADPALTTAWLTLDAADNDPRSFITYLVMALREQVPDFGSATLAQLENTADIEANITLLARTLAGEAQAALPGVCVMILDDFQEVSEGVAVRAFINDLLRFQPDNLRLLIASRTTPRLNVSSLIIQDQFWALQQSDLCFTTDELQELVRLRTGAALTEDEATVALAAAEGWIGGLLLSASGQWNGLLRGVTGEVEQPGLWSFLSQEAFDRQPAAIQRLLLDTSTPALLDEGTITAVLDGRAWRAQMDQLERSNLFIARLEGSEPLYRYHPMYREFLQYRLQRDDPTRYRSLHLSVARCFAARDEWPRAFEHYREAEEFGEAASAITRIAPELEAAGRWYELARAIDAVPPHLVAGNGRLMLLRARAAMISSDLDKAVESARGAIAVLRRRRDTLLRAEAHGVLGNTLRVMGQVDSAVENLLLARELAPPESLLMAEVQHDLAICHLVQGELEQARTGLEQARAAFIVADRTRDAGRASLSLGVTLSRLGRTVEAAAMYEAAQSHFQDARDEPNYAVTLNNLGHLRLFQSEYSEAQSLLDEGYAIAERIQHQRTLGNIAHSRATLMLVMGDPDAAVAMFRHGLQVAEEVGDQSNVALCADGLGYCYLFLEKPETARSWFQRAAAVADRQRSAVVAARVAIGAALVDIRAGRPAGAAERIDQVRRRFLDLGQLRDATHATACLAIALYRTGDRSGARERMREAVDLATRLGLPALLDLPARLDPEAFSATTGDLATPVLTDTAVGKTQPARVRRSTDGAPPALPRLVVRSFGPGMVYRADQSVVAWPRDASREAFFYLVYMGSATSEQLGEAIRPEFRPAQQRHTVYAAVRGIRTSIHAGAVPVANNRYAIKPYVVAWHDVAHFDQLLETAGRTTEPERGAALLEEAAGLYAGPLLTDIDHPWAVALRRTYEEKVLSVNTTLIDLHAARGDWTAAAAAAERALALDPSSARFSRALEALINAGNRRAAAALRRRYARFLRRNPEETPDPRWTELTQRLRRMPS